MTTSQPSGLLEVDALKKMVDAGAVETVLTVFPDLYGRLLGKRISGRFFIDTVLNDAIHVCDYLLACDMEMDPVPGYAFTSWQHGYGDMRLIPDLRTLRLVDWLEKTALVICDAYQEETDELIDLAPRSVLKNQVRQAAADGYLAMGASELELYVFQETYESAAQKDYNELQTFGRYIEDYHILQGTKEEFVIGAIRHHLARSGVPIEFSKGEWGPGQQEINLCYADFLEMADRHAIYKHAAKEIAIQKRLCGDVHGQVGRTLCRFQYASACQPLGPVGEQGPVCRRRSLRTAEDFKTFSLVFGGVDATPAGSLSVLRPLSNLLQTVCGRLLRADGPGLEL